jgi:uncharacterized protein YbjT (DUF2867 family)
MKIVITGSLGNIGRNLTQNLVANDHDVTVVTSDANRQTVIESLGAKAAVGSVLDSVFLTEVFRGADSVFTMIPPNYTAKDFQGYFADVAQSYIAAIRQSGVSHVVNLSTMGANLAAGFGPLTALNLVEKAFAALENTNVVHVRPGGFFTNYLWDIPLIKAQEIMGNNYPESTRLVLTHPADTAEAVAGLLQTKDFSGHDVRYVVSDDLVLADVVSLIAKSVGKTNLRWVQFPDDALAGALIENGFSETAAQGFVEMGHAFADGEMFRDYDRNKNKAIFGNRKFSEFAENEFKAAFNA